MKFGNEIEILMLCLVALAQSGCSRSPEEAHDASRQADYFPVKTNSQPAILNSSAPQLAPLTNSIASKSNAIWLEEVRGDDPIYRFMATDLIAKSPRARAAFSQATSALDDGNITSRDIESITSELAYVSGFVPSSHGGTAVKFDRFVIAIVGGNIGERYVNTYLIRIPTNKWIFLDAREAPTPLGTFGQ